MKTILSIIFFCFLISTNINAQKVGQLNLSDLDVEYIHITGYTNTIGPFASNSSRFVLLDYGQEVINAKERKILKNNSQPIRFNSPIEAINFMHQLGYEFVANIATEDGATFRYLLRKEQD